MQKCLKELESRMESANNMNLSIDEAVDDLELINLKISNIEKKKYKKDINNKYREIQIRKLNRKKSSLTNSITNLKKKLKETEEEMAFFTSAFKQLEKIEPLKKYDDLESNQKIGRAHV